MISVVPDEVRQFAQRVQTCVIGTTRADGTIRQSVVYFVLDEDRVLVSTLGSRGKALDVERTGRASICVFGHEPPFPCAVLEGSARVVTDRHEAGEVARAVMRDVVGVAPDRLPDDDQLAAAGRVVLEIAVDRCYGASHLSAGGG